MGINDFVGGKSMLALLKNENNTNFRLVYSASVV